MIEWRRELGQAARSLRKTPGLTATAVLSLAVASGVVTTVFSVLNAMALRDLVGVVEQDRVVSLGMALEGGSFPGLFGLSDVAVVGDRGDLFASVTAAGPTEVSVETSGDPFVATAEVVVPNYFETLGTRPAAGRFFVSEEGEPGAATAVVSWRFWQEQLGGEAAVGRLIRVNGRAVSVVGVAPEAFTGMTPGDVLEGERGSPSVWLPMGTAAWARPSWARGGEAVGEARWLRVAARLAPGVTRERLGAALPVLAAALERGSPEARRGARLFRGDLVFGPGAGDWRPAVTIAAFLIVPLLVLIMAAANAASAMLARTADRTREMAVRAALGARASMLRRRVLLESVLMALAAGALGLIMAFWSRQLAAAFSIRLVSDVPLDYRVFGFALAAAVGVGLLAGAVPALRAARAGAAGALAAAGRSTDGVDAVRLRNGLVAVQVAVSVLLLVGSGLFVRSVGRGMSLASGVDEDGLVLFTLDPSVLGYDAGRSRALLTDLLAATRSLPDVREAGFSELPLLEGFPSARASAGGGEMERAAPVSVAHVGARWFGAAGVPVLSGSVGAQPGAWRGDAVALSRTAADRYFPGGAPLGQTLRVREGAVERTIRVTAVVEDVRPRLQDAPAPVLYLPFDGRTSSAATLYVRAGGSPESAVRAVRDVVRQLDPALPLQRVETASQVRRRQLLNWSLLARAMAGLGGIALVLALTGLYGVVSYSVARRTREIGVRVALGADRAAVLRMVARQALGPVVVGLCVGGAAAAAGAVVVRSLFFGLSPVDPLTYGATAVLLLLVSLAAVAPPAHRAASVDPARALVD